MSLSRRYGSARWLNVAANARYLGTWRAFKKNFANQRDEPMRSSRAGTRPRINSSRRPPTRRRTRHIL